MGIISSCHIYDNEAVTSLVKESNRCCYGSKVIEKFDG